MPRGKAPGERCLHLSSDYLCQLFGLPQRPAVCSAFQADPMMCGDNRQEAIRLIDWYEQATAV